MSKTKGTGLVLVAMALSFGLAGPARADDQEALRLYTEGKEALQQGDLETARDRLEAALAIGEGAGLFLRLAELEEKSDHPAKCLDYAERAVAKAESTTPKLRRVLAAAEKQRAKCDEITPMLTIRLPDTLPEDAAVYEDGKRLKVSGGKLVRRLEPGEHTYRLEAPGRGVSSKVVRVEAGERAELELGLGPADSGSVPWKSISTWTGVGLLGVGVLAGAAAISAKGDLDDQCNDKSCPASAESDFDRSAQWATISTVGFIGGAALLGLGLYVLEDEADDDTKARDASRVRIDVEASPRAGVLTGTWQF